MDRYQAVLSYDGTEFSGFESQLRARTVQGVLEKALEELGWQGRRILAAGRTDAGVHAAGQVIAFDLEWRHGSDALMAALNAQLPEDVGVQRVMRARADFHPRFDAQRRCYCYRVYIARQRDPLSARFMARLANRPDVVKMNEAAAVMIGAKDYHAFGTAPRKGSHTRRIVFRAEWLEPESNRLEFWIEANAFLYRMVRITVGTLLQIGRGDRSIESLRQLMDPDSDIHAGPAAPAQGLCLEKIVYPEDVVAEISARETQASSSLES
jgi:tRNA pseudouridine38-40 synthase